MDTKINADTLSQGQKIQTLFFLSTFIAFALSILIPSLYICQLTLAVGMFWAGRVLYQSCRSQPDVEHKAYWLKQTIWMICTALVGVPMFLICLPVGHRSAPDQLWVGSAMPLGQHTAPYVLPILMFTLFLVLLYGAAKISPTMLDCLRFTALAPKTKN